MVNVGKIDKNNATHLNIVIAFIGLCLAFTYFLPNESVNRILQSAFGRNPFDITVNRLILIIVAFTSLTGSAWYLSSSLLPNAKTISAMELLPHLLIPVFSSVTLAYALSQLIRTPWWWLVFIIGLALLAIVLISEQADMLNIDQTTPVPMISLTSLSIGLYLLGLVVLRTIGPRLFVLVPLVGLMSAFIVFRFTSLRTNIQPTWEVILGIVLILAQLAAALYYLFINALQFGIILTGLLYFLVTLSVGLQNEKKGFNLLAEPLSMLLIIVILTGLTFLL